MEEEYQEIDQQERDLMMDNKSYNQIDLQEKNIEPSQEVSGKLATRNLQMGNITRPDFNLMSINIDSANKLLNIPYEMGGFLSHDVADNMFRGIDLQLLLSNSVEGFVRRTNQTVRNIIEKNKTMSKTKSVLNNLSFPGK